MAQLEYVAPSTVADAVKALAGAGGAGRLMAGGTDLLVQRRTGRLQQSLIIDVKRIPDLVSLRIENGGFVVGAATSAAQLAEHEAFAKAWPGVLEAANLIGSTQIQGRASMGGNLCNASPAADSVPALVAADAVCIIEGPKGRRELPVEAVQQGPGRTALAADEILVAFRFPKRPARASDAYLRLIPRTEMDIAVVGAGVCLELDGKDVVTAARVSVGAVAPTALLVADAGKALVGGKLEPAALAAMEAAVRAACRPISDKRGSAAYRTKVAGVLARRAALIAYERARA